MPDVRRGVQVSGGKRSRFYGDPVLFSIPLLKVAAFEPLARGRVNKLILSQTNQTHTLHLLITYV